MSEDPVSYNTPGGTRNCPHGGSLTTEAWLAAFAAGAGRQPGWFLAGRKLRRRSGLLLVSPLLAQWNYEHPRQRRWSNSAVTLTSLWRGTLEDGGFAVEALMIAADGTALHLSSIRELRAQLLAACARGELKGWRIFMSVVVSILTTTRT